MHRGRGCQRAGHRTRSSYPDRRWRTPAAR
jgi:hypothetical protein